MIDSVGIYVPHTKSLENNFLDRRSLVYHILYSQLASQTASDRGPIHPGLDRPLMYSYDEADTYGLSFF